MIACMGGWCRQREKCAHYTAPSRVISERLCDKAKEEPEYVKAIEWHERKNTLKSSSETSA